MSPGSVTILYPIDAIRPLKHCLHCADSSPVQILLSYKAYFFLSETGDKLGITTLAPALIPISLPNG